MKKNSVAASLRRIELLTIPYIIGIVFDGLSSDSPIGIYIGKVGTIILLTTALLEAVSLLSVRQKSGYYATAIGSFIFSAIIGTINIVLELVGVSGIALYAMNLLRYLVLLGSIVAVSMIFLGIIEQMKSIRNKRVAAEALRVVKIYFVLAASGVGLKILTGMLGASRIIVEASLAAAFAYIIVSAVAYIRFMIFLHKARVYFDS